MFESIPIRFLLSVVFGALVGMERESIGHTDTSGSAGGIRTFSLVSLFGALAGFFYFQREFAPFLILSIFISVLVIAYYVVGSLITKRSGLTNEISVMLTFVMGFLTTSMLFPMQMVVALLVVVLLILSMKDKAKRVLGGLSRHEIESFISYAIIALVILPFLPNESFLLKDIPYLPTFLEGYQVNLGRFADIEIFNLRKIWFIVALVTGIDVVGYLLAKLLGNKSSFTLASFVGGFISSTSTTQSLAQRSKKIHMIHGLVGAALLANLASFFQIFLLVGPLNSAWLVYITPMLGLIIISAFIVSVFFLSRKEKGKDTKNTATEGEKEHKIFSLKPALKFAILLIGVKFVTKICLLLFGKSGFMVSSVIASFAGIDAIVVNLADMAGKMISFKTALLTLILVNTTNLASKSFYSFLQGHKKFAFQFTIGVLVVVGASFVSLLFL